MNDTEAEILAPIAEAFRRAGFDVHQEVAVELHGTTCVADMICRSLVTPCVVVIEGKRQLDRRLMEQCERWLPFASQVLAVVPEIYQHRGRHLRRADELAHVGIGLVRVRPNGSLRWVHGARYKDDADHTPLLAALCYAQTHGPAAGSAGAKRVRPDGYDDLRRMMEDRWMTTPESAADSREIAREMGWRPNQRREFCRLAGRGEIRGIVTDGTKTKYWLEAAP